MSPEDQEQLKAAMEECDAAHKSLCAPAIGEDKERRRIHEELQLHASRFSRGAGVMAADSPGNAKAGAQRAETVRETRDRAEHISMWHNAERAERDAGAKPAKEPDLGRG